MRDALLFVLATACTSPGEPLAAITDGEVYISAFGATSWNSPNVIVDVWSADCRAFDHRLQAYVGDAELAFEGPWEPAGDGCTAAQARGPLDMTQAPLALTLADPTDVWTVTFPGPYRSEIEIGPLVAGNDVTIAWPDALPIVNACVRIEVNEPLPLFHGCVADHDDEVLVDPATNTLHFVAPTRVTDHASLWVELVTQVDLSASPGDKTLPRCDGPAHCNVTVYGERRVDVAIAP